jgi:hypothetical protein
MIPVPETKKTHPRDRDHENRAQRQILAARMGLAGRRGRAGRHGMARRKVAGKQAQVAGKSVAERETLTID